MSPSNEEKEISSLHPTLVPHSSVPCYLPLTLTHLFYLHSINPQSTNMRPISLLTVITLPFVLTAPVPNPGEHSFLFTYFHGLLRNLQTSNKL